MSWSVVVATMQVNVSIGSCALIGEILTIGLRRVVVGALNVESQCSWAAVPVFVTALTMWLGNEFEFRRPSLEREVQLDVCVHCSSCGTLRDVVHYPLVGSTIVVGGICVAESSGWSFTPDGTFDTVWDCVLPMFGRYTIFYFQFQGDVKYVCMLNDWIAASTKFALTIKTLPSSS